MRTSPRSVAAHLASPLHVALPAILHINRAETERERKFLPLVADATSGGHPALTNADSPVNPRACQVRKSRKKKSAAERREALAKLGGAVPLENGLMTAGDDDWLFGAASLRSTPWEVPSVERAKLAKETHVFAEVPVQQTEDDLLAEPEKPVAVTITAVDADDDDPLGGDDQLFGGAVGIF